MTTPDVVPNTDLDPDGKFDHGLPDQADAALQKEYAQYCLAVYRSRSKTWVNELLKEYFKEDFKKFTPVMFQALPQIILRDIRDHLRSHGVFVPL